MQHDGQSDFDAPAAARSGTVDLRGECPREIVNVLDAVSMAREMTRTQLVNEILGGWAAKKRHELTLLQRLDGGKPMASEPAGGGRNV